MKIRIDFVTNSSSSSFVVVGISDEDLLETIAEKAGVEWDDDDYAWYGVVHHDDLVFVGYEGYPYYVGLDAADVLNNMTIPQAKEYFRKLIKERYGIDIPASSIGFHYGEVSS